MVSSSRLTSRWRVAHLGSDNKINNLRFSPGTIVVIGGLFCRPSGTWFPLWLTYPRTYVLG
jgi:hypothetical protein